MNRRTFYSEAFLLPALIFYFVFFILPNLLSLVFGFTDWTVFDMKTIRFNGLDNFKQMLDEPIFLPSIVHTFYFTFASVILSNAVGFLLALVLNSKLKFRSFYRSVFFVPTTLSMLVVAPVFNALYNPQNGPINVALRKLGLGFMAKEWLVDSHYAMNAIVVMSVWAGIGLTIILYLSGLQTVPDEYNEAAKIDGCGYWQRVKNVALPLIMPTITINMVLSLVGGLKVFAQVYALTNGGPDHATEVFGTLIFKNFGAGLLGYSSAVGLVFTLVVCAFTFILIYAMRRMEVEF